MAFIGISNWAIDPAKMNRGILVHRGIPDDNELQRSARGICGDEDVLDLTAELFEPFSELYTKIFDEALKKCQQEFFGLRDFYSLVKNICRRVKNTRERPTPEDLRRAILQNFSGLDGINPLKIFSDIMKWDSL